MKSEDRERRQATTTQQQRGWIPRGIPWGNTRRDTAGDTALTPLTWLPRSLCSRSLRSLARSAPSFAPFPPLARSLLSLTHSAHFAHLLVLRSESTIVELRFARSQNFRASRSLAKATGGDRKSQPHKSSRLAPLCLQSPSVPAELRSVQQTCMHHRQISRRPED